MRTRLRDYVTQEALGDWDLPWIPRVGECLKIDKAIGPDEYIIQRITHELNGLGYVCTIDVQKVP